MKFDPYSWQEVPGNEEVEVRKGHLRLLTSHQAPVYVTAQGVEALASVGCDHKIELAEAVTIRVDLPKGARAFLHVPDITSVVAAGTVFTNIDRMVEESGSMLEVRRAVREFELQRREILAQMKADREAFNAEREAMREKAVAPNEKPVVKPDDGAAVEDEKETPPAKAESDGGAA